MLNDFKKFALKGNVMDLAIGVIIGGAFGKIVTSLVNDVIMPFFGIILGGVKISSLAIPFGEAELKYGAFLQTIVDFIIIAFSIFLFIRLITRFKRKETEVKTAEIKADVKEELLIEIRDLLKKQTEFSDSTIVRDHPDKI